MFAFTLTAMIVVTMTAIVVIAASNVYVEEPAFVAVAAMPVPVANQFN